MIGVPPGPGAGPQGDGNFKNASWLEYPENFVHDGDHINEVFEDVVGVHLGEGVVGEGKGLSDVVLHVHAGEGAEVEVDVGGVDVVAASEVK